MITVNTWSTEKKKDCIFLVKTRIFDEMYNNWWDKVLNFVNGNNFQH